MSCFLCFLCFVSDQKHNTDTMILDRLRLTHTEHSASHHSNRTHLIPLLSPVFSCIFHLLGFPLSLHRRRCRRCMVSNRTSIRAKARPGEGSQVGARLLNQPRRRRACAAWHASWLPMLALRFRCRCRCSAVLLCYRTQLLSLTQVPSRRSTHSHLISSAVSSSSSSRPASDQMVVRNQGARIAH
jgi:hypothetical protein